MIADICKVNDRKSDEVIPKPEQRKSIKNKQEAF